MELTILKNLVLNDEYVRRVLPFIKEEYFNDYKERNIFKTIKNYIENYNGMPTKEALIIELDKDKKLDGSDYELIINTVGEVYDMTKPDNIDWLLKETESFCQDQAMYGALMQAVKIADDSENKSLSRGSIPDILKEALSVSFDQNIGHDFIEDADDRYEFYHQKVSRIPFDIELMNTITEGGLKPKTLNVLMAGPGAGKTLAMCHFAASNLMDGKNVLYITMEIAEEEIAKRIEANLLNTDISQIGFLPKDLYKKRIEKLKQKTQTKLKIKEYPTSSANVNHFRFLMNELKLKKDFIPDIIYIDYLNICASARYKAGSSANSYTIVKAVAEEIRGLATEFKVPIVSATQVNRSGIGNSDIDMENLSDSMGTGHTSDLILALITSEELDNLGQIQVKQIKNRYSDPTKNKRFSVGIDRSKMRWYDVSNIGGGGSSGNPPIEKSSGFVSNSTNSNSIKDKFKGWKV